MLKRWGTITENINLFVCKVKKLARKVAKKIKNKRGRPPKHKIEKYLTLIAAKEFDKKSLRGAETRLSKEICKERVDHSVISYWENKPEVNSLMAEFINKAGALLENSLGYEFSVIDATEFTNWGKDGTDFHLFNRICGETVYPIGISFLQETVAGPVNEAVKEGNKNLYADAGYDDNNSIGIMFRKGYTPIVSPHPGRWKGYHRKKARKFCTGN
jgi:hypothetical protein